MSDGSLSQDEIDALLQGTDTLELDSGAPEYLSATEASAFQGLLAGIAETMGLNLGTITGKTVNVSRPEVVAEAPDEILAALPPQVVDVKINFTEGLVGEHSFVLATPFATTVATLMMGQEGIELDDAALSAVGEAISNLTGSALTPLGNQLGRTLRIDAPEPKLSDNTGTRLPPGEAVVRVDYNVEIEGEDPGVLTELYSLSLVKEVAAMLSDDSSMAGAPAQAAAAPVTAGPEALGEVAAAGIGDLNLGGGDAAFGQPFDQGGGFGAPQQANVQPVQFANLQAPSAQHEQGNIGLLMDVDMEMTVELGRTKWSIRDILGIGEGTIIELDKLAGEPVDILVNHKPLAKGEVVVIDENFGVRVTEIISPMERVGNLT
jgi:flagellar motor switch protein FliN/FliY